jgi:hypothetical protein
MYGRRSSPGQARDRSSCDSRKVAQLGQESRRICDAFEADGHDGELQFR